MERYFRGKRERIVGAAGRLSPEKGFDVLIEAAARVIDLDPTVGFVLFGDGPCKPALMEQIGSLGLTGSVVLAGFRNDLDRFIPQLDLFVLPSYTEGLPNVVLEACAAGVPVVATAVGVAACQMPPRPLPLACPDDVSPAKRYSGRPSTVTCEVPSGRVMTLTVAVTPAPAVGAPVTVSGGHSVAHDDVQALVPAPGVSLSKT